MSYGYLAVQKILDAVKKHKNTKKEIRSCTMARISFLVKNIKRSCNEKSGVLITVRYQ